MMNILRILCFMGFISLGLAVVWARKQTRHPRQYRILVNVFLLYCLVASFGAGLTQREAWPFSTWPLVAGILPPVVTQPRVLAVDRYGVEHHIDYRAWQPFVSDELLAWLNGKFLQLDTAAQERVGTYLLHLVEASRARAHLGQGVGYFDRLLGPLTAPYFLLHPALWSRPGSVPATPFVGLRLYRETWHVEARHRDARKMTRQLVYTYEQP